MAIDPAAKEYGLGFLPLREERYDFANPGIAQWYETEAGEILPTVEIEEVLGAAPGRHRGGEDAHAPGRHPVHGLMDPLGVHRLGEIVFGPVLDGLDARPAVRARLEHEQLPARLPAGSPTRALFETLGPHFPIGQRIAFANLWLTRPLVLNTLEKGAATNAMIRTTTAGDFS